MRSQQQIFDDLAALAAEPGFVYAIATINLRDHTVFYKDELQPKDMASFFSQNRLNRNEVMTLIGLLMRRPIDFAVPNFDTVQNYIRRAEELLEELHQKLAGPIGDFIKPNVTRQASDPLASAAVIREAVFYAAESAYPFQHRDLAPRKYKSDLRWLLRNRSIDLQATVDLCHALAAIFNRRSVEARRKVASDPASEQTVVQAALDLFTFSITELAAYTGRPVDTIRAIVKAFAFPAGQFNKAFTSLQAFNEAYAYPFLPMPPDCYLQLQPNGISEALYDTPFYWMLKDQNYASTALQHRGNFTEEFASECLVRVFGETRVFRNVEIYRSKGESLGEIDALVLFGDRAIVLRAKSKRLRLGARQGNAHQLREDFKAAIQDAVDQAFTCAQLLGDPSVVLRARDGRQVSIPQRPQIIYPLTIVADHYPALAFQARQFLDAQPTGQIVAPLVTDVFALDAMTEMLASPLRFLSYLGLRAGFGDKLMFSHELTVLSLHLKRNLWVRDDIDILHLEDDIAASLDAAMAVRRDSVSGQPTPKGILQWFDGTPLGTILAQIETSPIPAAVDFGLMVLQLDETKVQNINRTLRLILTRSLADGRLHDMSYFVPHLSFGMTVYCSQLTDQQVHSKLRPHCHIQKYAQKANLWFGLALRPAGIIQSMGKLNNPWAFDSQMQTAVANSPFSQSAPDTAKGRVGRNQPCPCGSGLKHKRCCITH